jgi:hypothetical protein
VQAVRHANLAAAAHRNGARLPRTGFVGADLQNRDDDAG